MTIDFLHIHVHNQYYYQKYISSFTSHPLIYGLTNGFYLFGKLIDGLGLGFSSTSGYFLIFCRNYSLMFFCLNFFWGKMGNLLMASSNGYWFFLFLVGLVKMVLFNILMDLTSSVLVVRKVFRGLKPGKEACFSVIDEGLYWSIIAIFYLFARITIFPIYFSLLFSYNVFLSYFS